MAAPTLTATYAPATNWTGNGTFKTVSVTVAAGDRLVLKAACEAAGVTLTPSGGTGITWGTATSSTAASHCSTYMWVVDGVGSGQTFTLRIDKSGGSGSTDTWGMRLERWSNATGFGTPVLNTGASSAPSSSVTTAAANSVISCFNTDWNASSGSRTYRQVNSANPTEQDYFGVAGSTYIGEIYTYDDAGAAGAKTTGMTAPGSQNWTQISVEVKGTGGTNGTVNAVPAIAFGIAPAPAVSATRNPVVTAVAAMAAAAALVPAATGGGNVAPPPAIASARVFAPVVSVPSATFGPWSDPGTINTAADGTANAVPAIATAFGRPPVVSGTGAATVNGVPAIAFARAIAPTVSIPGATYGPWSDPGTIDTTTSATINAVPAIAFGLGRAPVVTGGGTTNGTVNAVPAIGFAMAQAPGVIGEQLITSGGPAVAFAIVRPPIVSGAGSLDGTVNAVKAVASAFALSPAVAGYSAGTVFMVPAIASATVRPPVVSATGSATVTARPAIAFAVARVPSRVGAAILPDVVVRLFRERSTTFTIRERATLFTIRERD